MDSKFEVDEKCNTCGICARVCPSNNIAMQKGRPVWNKKCDQCLACIQWCPKEAIQCGKKTAGYKRYHHPSITVGDIMKRG
jgi:MinD superfamily P-loop ATPase